MHKLEVRYRECLNADFSDTFTGRHLAEYSRHLSTEFKDWLIEEGIEAMVIDMRIETIKIETPLDFSGPPPLFGVVCVDLQFVREVDMLVCKMRWL